MLVSLQAELRDDIHRFVVQISSIIDETEERLTNNRIWKQLG
jgi:hypothetical protein